MAVLGLKPRVSVALLMALCLWQASADVEGTIKCTSAGDCSTEVTGSAGAQDAEPVVVQAGGDAPPADTTSSQDTVPESIESAAPAPVEAPPASETPPVGLDAADDAASPAETGDVVPTSGSDVQEEAVEESREAPRDLGSSINFASAQLGATVIYASNMVTHAGSILSGDRDKYMMSACGEATSVVVQLSEPVVLDTLRLTSLEYYASGLKRFEVLGKPPKNPGESTEGLVSESDQGWDFLGAFDAPRTREPQTFSLEEPLFVHYVKLKALEWHEGSSVCTLSLIEAFGEDEKNTLMRELDQHDEDLSKVIQDLELQADTKKSSFAMEEEEQVQDVTDAEATSAVGAEIGENSTNEDEESGSVPLVTEGGKTESAAPGTLMADKNETIKSTESIPTGPKPTNGLQDAGNVADVKDHITPNATETSRNDTTRDPGTTDDSKPSIPTQSEDEPVKIARGDDLVNAPTPEEIAQITPSGSGGGAMASGDTIVDSDARATQNSAARRQESDAVKATGSASNGATSAPSISSTTLDQRPPNPPPHGIPGSVKSQDGSTASTDDREACSGGSACGSGNAQATGKDADSRIGTENLKGSNSGGNVRAVGVDGETALQRSQADGSDAASNTGKQNDQKQDEAVQNNNSVTAAGDAVEDAAAGSAAKATDSLFQNTAVAPERTMEISSDSTADAEPKQDVATAPAAGDTTASRQQTKDKKTSTD